MGPDLPSVEVWRSQAHHARYDTSGWGIGPSQKSLPDNTQQSQENDTYSIGGIRTRNPSKRTAADPRLRPRDHWDRHSQFYLTRSQNCEKRLLASSCLSVRPHGTTRLPLDGFSFNLIFEDFSKICWENSILIKIVQEKRVLYMKTNIHFLK